MQTHIISVLQAYRKQKKVLQSSILFGSKFVIPILLLCCVHIHTIKAQDSLHYKYYVGHTEPPAGWQQPKFDDTSWPDGYFTIGYGDDDDSVLIDTTTSVYIRHELKTYAGEKEFEGDIQEIIALALYPDFDDGFIAYLNGTEILRINMDENLNPPSHLDTTIRSHEAFGYRLIGVPQRGYPLTSYYIDSSRLSAANFDTINTLAFQVHNDSTKGSDLTFNFDYRYLKDNFHYNIVDKRYRFSQIIDIDSTKFPLVLIETDEYSYIQGERIIAHMRIINNPGYNKPEDVPTDYNGRIRMNLRGNSTFDLPKAPFRIETQNADGNNNNVSLLGMPPENDWILYGPHSDKTMIKNELVFTWGRKMGYYEPRTRFCELILNERPMGLYVLTEKIKQDDNRVDVSNLNPNENEGDELTGGYVFRFDAGHLDIVYPREEIITTKQFNYISGFVQKVNRILKSEVFLDPSLGYTNYIDTSSLIDYILINELTKNIDTYWSSAYMYKDRDDEDGKIYYGPLWDYDGALGYSLWERLSTSGWQFEIRSTMPIKKFLQDPSLRENMVNRWQQLRKTMFHTTAMNELIDNLVTQIKPAVERNYRIWPIMNSNFLEDFSEKNYDEGIKSLKTWIEERSLWIDENIDNLYYPLYIDSYHRDNTKDAYFYPNPFNKELSLEINLTEPGNLQVEIRDLAGKIQHVSTWENLPAGKQNIPIVLDNKLNTGVYIVNVLKDMVPYSKHKLLKSE